MYTRIFSGPYAALLANYPARLSSINGSPGNFFVDTVRIEKGPGDTGTMTITLSPVPIKDWTFADNQVDEVEFIEVQKKLLSHPIFNPVTATSTHPNAGKYALSVDTDLDAIAEFEAASTAAARSAAYSALSDNAKAYADRVQRGQDTYVIYAPVLRTTIKNSSPQSNTRCGTVTTPPAAVRIDGYVYLQTADRRAWDGIWTQSKEWTGADFIDEEIYVVS